MDRRMMVVKSYVDDGLFVNAHYWAHKRGQSLSTWIEEILREAVLKESGGVMLRSLTQLEGQLELESEGIR